MSETPESRACQPEPVSSKAFNPKAEIPYGCTADSIKSAMNEFIEFLSFVNQQLHTRNIPRLESMMMPANFSSLVGEFMATSIPKYCSSVVRNQYHNGHPDLIPAGAFVDNAVQHTNKGIEIKASRYESGWQGHNPEDTWLLVFIFDSNRPTDIRDKVAAKPFRFLAVVGARLSKKDWVYSGRSKTSRRTITASVKESGYRKMMKNWIFKAPDFRG